MPLESCMILLDCSQYMRNGDYIPTRFEAQQDAANLLVGTKMHSNQESTVGISAGSELLVSPTTDLAKVLGSIHGLNLQSVTAYDVSAAVQVASLALKHRRNKNGSQRIVLFVGTPLTDVDSRTFQKAGRQLKKNNVAIDVIALGELEANEAKLRELVDAANSSGSDGEERTCHLVTIPAGVLPSEVLATSPILASSGGAYAAAAIAASGFGADGAGSGGIDGGTAFAEYGGVDPNLDPELAMALRVSMEEERVRQERLAAQTAAAAAAAEESGGHGVEGDSEMTDAASGSAAAVAAAAAVSSSTGLSEEEEMLQKALTMSMEENTTIAIAAEEAKTGDDVEMEDDDDDAAMQMALAMSMQQDGGDDTGAANTFQDPTFVQQLLGGTNADPELQEALRKAAEDASQQQKKKDDDDNNNNDNDAGDK